MEIPIWAIVATVSAIGGMATWIWKYFVKKIDANSKEISTTKEMVEEKFEDIKTLVYANGNKMQDTVGMILKTMASDKDEVKEKINTEIKELERYVSANFERKK